MPGPATEKILRIFHYLKSSIKRDSNTEAAPHTSSAYYRSRIWDYEKQINTHVERIKTIKADVEKGLDGLQDEKALALAKDILKDIDSFVPALHSIRNQLPFVVLLVLQEHKRDFEKERELLSKMHDPAGFKSSLVERIKDLGLQDVKRPFTTYLDRLTGWIETIKRGLQTNPVHEFHQHALKDAQECSELFSRLKEYISLSLSEYALEQQTKKIEDQTSEMQKMHQKIGALEARCGGLSQTVHGLNSTIGQLNDKISRLQYRTPNTVYLPTIYNGK